MPYVRVKTSVRSSLRLTRCSDRAQRVWYAGLTLAEDCACRGAQDGAFVMGSLGPMSLSEIAIELRVPEKAMQTVVDELVRVDLWSVSVDGTISVCRFAEETTPSDPRAAERMRRYRARKNDEHVTASRDVLNKPEQADATERNVTANITANERERYGPQGTRDSMQSPSEPAAPESRLGLVPASSLQRQPVQGALPNPDEQRARDILALFWARVETTVGRSKTRTEWGKQNKRFALDLARVARSDDDLIAAHESASLRLGGTVHMLNIVADELVRMDNPRGAQRRSNRPSPGFDANLETGGIA